MGDESAPEPNMRDLMAPVAYVLLHWGWLEEEVRARIKAIEPDRQLSEQSVWVHWREVEPGACQRIRTNIEMLVDVRNCLAHGLCGANADPRSGNEPHVVCHAGASQRHFNISELEQVADALHVARNAVRDGRI
ncbi:MAG: hypothetical protein E5X48_25060 [Mesorhizobium sp.]|uniref:hypothetical protein n=1 Tax=Mesorhizobium sp. TaxID=1871066 RepID=UPI0012187856|nr:hypothetical protein [Mesorhizobium sp.]TIQ33081.1 MAG: hypothetical protein E5X48_25060 [Mesorhizobium sp.]